MMDNNKRFEKSEYGYMMDNNKRFKKKRIRVHDGQQ